MSRGEFVCQPGDVYVDLTDMVREDSQSVKYIFSEYGRRLTFPTNSLPYSQDIIKDLARYGFIWVFDCSRLGRVRCVYCNIEILDYDDNSPAAIEHEKRNLALCSLYHANVENIIHHETPLCLPETSRVSYMIQLEESNKRNITYEWYDYHGAVTRKTFRAPGFAEEYKYEHVRLGSFYDGDSTNPMPAADLSKYGFVCKGPGGSVACYACGLFVSNWQPNDLAALIHFKYSPNCPHMNHLPSREKWPHSNSAVNQLENEDAEIHQKDYFTYETMIHDCN